MHKSMTPNASPRPWQVYESYAGGFEILRATRRVLSVITAYHDPAKYAEDVAEMLNAYEPMRDALEAARDMLKSARAVEHAYACTTTKHSDLCVRYGEAMDKITAALAKAGEGTSADG